MTYFKTIVAAGIAAVIGATAAAQETTTPPQVDSSTWSGIEARIEAKIQALEVEIIHGEHLRCLEGNADRISNIYEDAELAAAYLRSACDNEETRMILIMNHRQERTQGRTLLPAEFEAIETAVTLDARFMIEQVRSRGRAP